MEAVIRTMQNFLNYLISIGIWSDTTICVSYSISIVQVGKIAKSFLPDIRDMKFSNSKQKWFECNPHFGRSVE